MIEQAHKGNLKGLNTLRFMAFFVIFLFHSFDIFSYGYLGVDLFFVLSSFLLTFLALKEIELTHSFSQKNFFVRRALRIFPLYFFVVITLTVFLPILSNIYHLDISFPEKPYLYWTFLSNFDKSNHIFALKFLWSIAVEEQFYILFLGLSFFFTRSIWIPISILLVSYFIYMSYSNTYFLDTYSHVVPHFANFAIGMIMAWLFYYKRMTLDFKIIFCLICGLFAYLFYDLAIVFNICFSFFIGGIIVSMIESYEVFPILSKIFYPTEILGRYSYGLYVYSGIIITFGKKYLPYQNELMIFFIELIVLFIVSILSYHIFEKRFIDMKKRFYKKKSDYF
jgi:peptidoglycan/LPS O-acetylase OafA/YrhL